MSQEFIENYALVGDCHGCALISRHGSVDWLTIERFDESPALWKILDNEAGAYLQINPVGDWQWSRHYLSDTNILITEAKNEKTLFRIIDFMPVGRVKESKNHDYTNLKAIHALVRVIEIEGDPVEVTITQKDNFWPEAIDSFYTYVGTDTLALNYENSSSISLSADKPYFVVLSKSPKETITAAQIKRVFEVTKSYWKEWINYSVYRGPYKDLIERSALILKLLMHAPSGAILAAPTTSLPESIGNERNWDYRYCWPRDATFTLYALAYLGFSGEADSFSDYFDKVICRTSGPISVLYSIDGEAHNPEKIIEGISGYRGSSPVRVGNDAYKQKQHDVFGEFVDWAYLHKQLGGKLSDNLLKKIEETAELVQTIWKEKDHGLWEVRGEKEDFTYSKVMCWVTLDRAESLLNSPGKYQKDKEEIEAFIKERCTINGRLKKSAQSDDLDASLLLSKIVGFPIDENLYRNTLMAIMDTLSDGTFVKRYISDDGLEGDEGQFLTCSFWAVNAFLFLGMEAEAKTMFEKLITCFNDVGLLSEEIDISSGHFLGNYPQALSHLAFIETASYFELYAKGGKEALSGCHGDRVREMHTTLHGPRAVWHFIIKTRNFKKIFPSRSSILELH